MHSFIHFDTVKKEDEKTFFEWFKDKMNAMVYAVGDLIKAEPEEPIQ